jgi:hypothetical protein
MFLTRKQVIIRNLKKFGEALVGGFLLALPFLLAMFIYAIG